MNIITTIETINQCSVCKNKDSKLCDNCIVGGKEHILPSNFLADTSKINPHFVDSYYVLLNKFTQLLKNLGLECKLDTYDIGD